jgi:hypothetical protein
MMPRPLNDPNALESVLDSSRYFVVRVVNGPRHAFIGNGFQERNEAFDLKRACAEAQKAANEFESSQVSCRGASAD